MNDLIKLLMERAKIARSEGTGTGLGDALHFEVAADRITAMKAAGDGLAGFAGHIEWECGEQEQDTPHCTCGYTAALKQWKEASDGL